MMDPIGLSLKVGRTFSLDFWWAVDIENISTIMYPMLLIIILKFFLYVGCCMAHNKISVSISICWSHTKNVRNWKWGEFTQPALNINTNLTFCFQADFLAGFDFPDKINAIFFWTEIVFTSQSCLWFINYITDWPLCHIFKWCVY